MAFSSFIAQFSSLTDVGVTGFIFNHGIHGIHRNVLTQSTQSLLSRVERVEYYANSLPHSLIIYSKSYTEGSDTFTMIITYLVERGLILLTQIAKPSTRGKSFNNINRNLSMLLFIDFVWIQRNTKMIVRYVLV